MVLRSQKKLHTVMIIIVNEPKYKHPILLVKRLHRTSVVRDFTDQGTSKLHQLHSGLEAIKISKSTL